MTDLLKSFILWLRDPFHRKEIAQRRNVLLQQMHAAQVVANERTHLLRGENVFDAALRGHRRSEP